MPLKDIGIGLFVTFVWGLNFPIGKIAVTEFPPIFMLAVRFGLVGLLLVFLLPVPYGRLKRLYLLSLSLGVLHFATMFTGLRMVDTSTAAICSQLQAPSSLLLGMALFGERPGWKRCFGLVLAFAGIVVVAGEPRLFDSLLGVGLIVFAAFLWAVAAMQSKNLGDLSPLQTNAWMGLFTAPQLMLLSFLVEEGQLEAVRNASWLGWSSILYMAVLVTILGYGMWYGLLRRHAVNSVMPFVLLVPIFGILSGILLLGDPVTPQFLGGCFLTIVGVAIIILQPPLKTA